VSLEYSADREHDRDFTLFESDIVWGAENIGAVINRGPRQTFHLLTRGEIKCARKVGGRWAASRSALLRELGAAA
jgi:hypothetical protein